MATQILVIWTYSLTDNTGFLLQRSTDSGSTWPTNFRTNAAATQYADVAVSVGGTYWYRVAATNTFGTGNFSSTASIFLTSSESTTLYLTVGPTPDTKTYDGTISSSQIPTITDGSIAPGDTAFFVQSFDTKHVASGKLIILRLDTRGRQRPAAAAGCAEGGGPVDRPLAWDDAGADFASARVTLLRSTWNYSEETRGVPRLGRAHRGALQPLEPRGDSALERSQELPAGFLEARGVPVVPTHLAGGAIRLRSPTSCVSVAGPRWS